MRVAVSPPARALAYDAETAVACFASVRERPDLRAALAADRPVLACADAARLRSRCRTLRAHRYAGLSGALAAADDREVGGARLACIGEGLDTCPTLAADRSIFHGTHLRPGRARRRRRTRCYRGRAPALAAVDDREASCAGLTCIGEGLDTSTALAADRSILHAAHRRPGRARRRTRITWPDVDGAGGKKRDERQQSELSRRQESGERHYSSPMAGFLSKS